MIRHAAMLALLVACNPSDPVESDTVLSSGTSTGSDTDSDTDSDSDTGESTHPETPAERVVIYQLVVRHFSNLNATRAVDGTLEQNGVGKFNDIDETAIDALKELGATHIWLTGIPRQATLTDWSHLGIPPDDPDVVKGRAGSFYSVKDYYDTSPDYAEDPERRMEELKALIDRIHDAGLKVLIDIVPNHVARGYGSLSHPERDFGAEDDPTQFYDPDNSFFYLADPPGQVLELTRPSYWNPEGVEFDGLYPPEDGTAPERTPKVTGNNVTSPRPSENDWYETIKLNWGLNFVTGETFYDPPPPVWHTFDEIVEFWQDMGVDGFRADFVHIVPTEGLSWVIAQAKARDPEFEFYAEAYDNLQGMLDAGFDGVYYDPAYDALKALYQGRASQAEVDNAYLALSDEDRHRWVLYLENHDERRIASPIVDSSNPDDSGFGSAAAGRQVAPIQYLITPGPILFYNGQEVGELGEGREGFSDNNGRSSIYDYGSLPALQGWVNDHAYDGGGLTPAQSDLREWYSDLLNGPVKDPAVRGSGYWGLRYLNNSTDNPGFPDDIYTFARFQPNGGRLLVVAVNFRPGDASSGSVKLPEELLDAAGLTGDSLRVERIFDERGTVEEFVEDTSRFGLTQAGFPAVLPDQTAAVFQVVPR
ncbi:MAG: alpha-amylase [Deltaproteobacteria bacterium]|nr:MAG: alpha-amylase [Deltaproteobacteria bacterium]